MTTDLAGRPDARRRMLLRGAPVAGLLALPGCGGGGAAAAQATAPSGNGPGNGTGTGTVAALPTVTAWASRPDAATSIGQAIMVTDVGVNGSIWLSNGSRWLPLSSPMSLFHRFSNAEMDGSVGANADAFLDGCTIPAYVLGPSSSLRIVAAYSFPGSGAGNKAPQVKAYFGTGSYAASFTSLLDTRGQFTTQKSFVLQVELQNKNSMAANQVRPYDYGIGASANAFSDAAIDFSQAVTVGFGALNNATSSSADDRQRLDWFSIDLVA